jgi:hypothetical protein
MIMPLNIAPKTLLSTVGTLKMIEDIFKCLTIDRGK